MHSASHKPASYARSDGCDDSSDGRRGEKGGVGGHCTRVGSISGSTGHWLPLAESRLNPMVLCTNWLSARAAISRCNASVLASPPNRLAATTTTGVVADASPNGVRADDRRRRMSPSMLLVVEHVRRPSIPNSIASLRDRFRADMGAGGAPGAPSCGTGAGLRPREASHSSTRRSLTLFSSAAGSRRAASAHWRRVSSLASRMMSPSCGWLESTISLSGHTATASAPTTAGAVRRFWSLVAAPLRSAGGVFSGDGTPRFLNALPARRNLDFARGVPGPGVASTAARGSSKAKGELIVGALGMRRSQLRTAKDGTGRFANGRRAGAVVALLPAGAGRFAIDSKRCMPGSATFASARL
mmetsp:Transcript_11261/g.34988  ORF Transcript_11261/g.34988 Transcript_11261/m.34988 type:complete len:356 (+) Transcript_11261:153-1220(+)